MSEWKTSWATNLLSELFPVVIWWRMWGDDTVVWITGYHGYEVLTKHIQPQRVLIDTDR